VSKTMSVRMDRENYDFLHEITKEERSDLSKAVRDLLSRDTRRERPRSAGLLSWRECRSDK